MLYLSHRTQMIFLWVDLLLTAQNLRNLNMPMQV